MTAIARSKVNIYIAPADTAPSLITSTYKIVGEIKSYSKSGGELDVESDPVFGGFVDKEKPQSQFEVAMEIVPSVDTGTQARWESMAYAYKAGVGYVATDSPADKAIFIESVNGTIYQTYGMNNCNITSLDVEHNADDNRTLNVTFKFSPTTPAGVSNILVSTTAVTSCPNMYLWVA